MPDIAQEVSEDPADPWRDVMRLSISQSFGAPIQMHVKRTQQQQWSTASGLRARR